MREDKKASHDTKRHEKTYANFDRAFHLHITQQKNRKHGQREIGES